MIRLPSFYPIDSLYNIFIGSTMINRFTDSTNCCNSFIMNKHINYITGFRINEK